MNPRRMSSAQRLVLRLLLAAPISLAVGCGDPSDQPEVVATVQVTLSANTVTEGQTSQASATVRDGNGNVLINRHISWKSSEEAVATISANGVVTANSRGSSVISATVEGKVGSTTISVTAPLVAAIEISLERSSVTVGATLAAMVILRDAAGNLLPPEPVVWSTSNSDIASVSPNGDITGIAQGGPVRISASIGSVIGTVTLLVGCRTPIALAVGEFILTDPGTVGGCLMELTSAGGYIAVPFISETGSPPVSTTAELSNTTVRLDLAGAAPAQEGATSPASAADVKIGRKLRSLLDQQREDHRMNSERRMLENLWNRAPSAATCDLIAVGSPIEVPTARYDASSGIFSGHFRDLGGPSETWRVALVTDRIVVVIDSVFWEARDAHPTTLANLAALARAAEASVLPTMQRFGMAPIDRDGDGRIMVLVPLVPFGSPAYASGLELRPSCPGVIAEVALVPSSRFETSEEFNNFASMADGASTLMHEFTHLYQSYQSTTTWYNVEGMARLGEHVWRLGSVPNIFSLQLAQLPVGSFEGHDQMTTTPATTIKHCVDPTWDGLDYLRIPGNIRAYDRSCWNLLRLGARMVQLGVDEADVFPSIMGLSSQAKMHVMWNEVNGASETADLFIAKWLAGAIMEESEVVPAEPTIRDPAWALHAVITNSGYAQESRVHSAVMMDAARPSETLTVIDESAQVTRFRSVANGALRVEVLENTSLDPSRPIRLLLIRID